MSSLEQRRRDLKEADPDLYGSIRHLEEAKALDAAGDLASGFTDPHTVANHLWRRAAYYRKAAQTADEQSR